MRLADFIVCEDVRQEIGNKMSIIGLYNDNLSFVPLHPNAEKKWPVTTRLAVFMSLLRDEDDGQPDRFDFTIMQHDKTVVSASGDISASGKAKKPIRLIVIMPQLAFQGPGQLKFQLLLKRGESVISNIAIDRPFTISMLEEKSPS